MDPVLKKRLLGAVVLIALAVIFLPMLIKGPAPGSGVSNVPMNVPKEPDGQFVEIPLATPEAVSSAGAVGMPAPLPAPAAAGSTASAIDASVQLPATAAAGDYAVNFGAYASQSDAETVAANLKKAGLPAYTATDAINGRTAVRVRIGNYGDRAQAEIVRLQALKVRNDVKATVVALDATPDAPAPQPIAATSPAAPVPPVASTPLPKPVPVKPLAPPVETPKPAAAAPAPEPVAAKPKPASQTASAPVATGFAVQVGAFGAASTANALRDKARAAGLSAFVEQINTDHGVLNRVRVGPVATREQADALAVQVKAKLGVDGKVVPHP